MFRYLTLFVALGLASCGTPKTTGVVLPGIPMAPAKENATPVTLDQIDISHASKPTTRAAQVVQTTLSGIPLTAVVFDSRSHRLAIADQPGGPGSRWADAEAAARDLGGIAAVNGGFFTPEGKPLGLLVTGGKRVSPPNQSSSLGAGLYAEEVPPVLVRREIGSDGSEILQSGPFLVENGHLIPGLSSQSSTARTFLGWDGRHGWFIARSGACSLAGLAAALAGSEIGGVKARTVLNLDGGRSSDLWVSAAVPGGPLSQRPMWNKPVRNFLILLPRH